MWVTARAAVPNFTIGNSDIMRFDRPMTRHPSALVALACLVAGCSTTVGGAATTAPTPPLVGAESLDAALLPATEVGAALGDDDLVVTREVDSPWDDGASFAARSVDEPGVARLDCLAIVGAAQRDVYADAGWTDLRGQILREPPNAPEWSHFAVQAVVLFPTAEAAADFYATARRSWAGCAQRQLAYAQQLAPDQVWSVGPVSTDNDVLTVSRSQRGPQRWWCQRALRVHSNVAADVEACSLDRPTAAAAAIAHAIGDRLPAP